MTGANAFSTEQGAMQQGANAVQEAHQQVQGLLQTLNGEVEQMMGGWGGQAATAFMGVHEAFSTQATKINQALDRMQEALVSTHTTYGTQESDQSQTFTNMSGNING